MSSCDQNRALSGSILESYSAADSVGHTLSAGQSEGCVSWCAVGGPTLSGRFAEVRGPHMCWGGLGHTLPSAGPQPIYTMYMNGLLTAM